MTKTNVGEVNIYIRRVNREKWRQFQLRVPKELDNNAILEALMDEIIAGRLYFENGKLGIRL